MLYILVSRVYNMKAYIKALSLAEVDEKNKMMVVRVSLDLYNLLQQEAEQLGITVSALVRSLFSFNYYPELADFALGQAQQELADRVEQAQNLDGGLAEYEARLSHLSENLALFVRALADEQERTSKARAQVLGILKTLTRDSDKV